MAVGFLKSSLLPIPEVAVFFLLSSTNQTADTQVSGYSMRDFHATAGSLTTVNAVAMGKARDLGEKQAALTSCQAAICGHQSHLLREGCRHDDFWMKSCARCSEHLNGAAQ